MSKDSTTLYQKACRCGGMLRTHQGITAMELLGVMTRRPEWDFMMCWDKGCNAIAAVKKSTGKVVYLSGRKGSDA